MKIIDTSIDSVKIIEPTIFEDERGFFFESFNKLKFNDFFGNLNFVQDNFSQSSINVLRGLHFQIKKPQGKLVSCSNGRVFDVAVDINPDSRTFRKHVSAILSSENKRQLWVPPGFAHGFLALSDDVHLHYKCTDYYDKNDEGGIVWNDKDLDVEWPSKNPILSEKDLNASKLADLIL